MKNNKTLIALFFICFCGLIWNGYLVFKYKKMYKLKEVQVERVENAFNEIQNAVVKANTYAMKFQGKTLYLSDISKIYPETETKQNPAPGPRLILVFSELGCNVCQDKETEFAAGIARKFGSEKCMVIIHSQNIRYARNYIRINRVKFPVYYCRDADFLLINNIGNTPMIFVVDENDRIVASHFPIPGHPVYSKPIHEFCLKYFEQ